MTEDEWVDARSSLDYTLDNGCILIWPVEEGLEGIENLQTQALLVFLGEYGRCECFGKEVGAPSSQLEDGICAYDAEQTRDDLGIEGGIGEGEIAGSIELLDRVGDVGLGGHCW